MKGSLIWCFCIACLSFSARADYSVQGIKILCTKDAFVISAHTLHNKKPSNDIVNEGKGNKIFYGTKTHAVSCLVGARSIKAEIKNREHRLKGACGASPGSYVTVWIDDTPVMQRQLFNNYCYQSIDSISFRQSKNEGFVTKICGNGNASNFDFEGCFIFKQDRFLSQEFPLGQFPLSDFMEKDAHHPTKKQSNANEK